MPRSRYIRSVDFPYHITGRCHGRRPFPLALSTVWEIFSEELYLAHRFHGLDIHSFVLMPNHFHLLATCGTGELSQAMHRVMQSSAWRINASANREGKLWGQRFFRCLVTSPHYFLNAYKYVYYNPVKAKLIQRAEDWPYSTLFGSLGQRHQLIPQLEDNTLFDHFEETLRWLNLAPKGKHWKDMNQALHRQKFRLPVTNRRTKSHPLDEQLL